jgi:hypothetical protein
MAYKTESENIHSIQMEAKMKKKEEPMIQKRK